MSRTLILLGEHLDKLWQRYVPTGGLVYLVGPGVRPLQNSALKSPPAPLPHYLDILGWRRWLKTQPIEKLFCYQPSCRTRALLAAAAFANLEIHLQLTGYLNPSTLRVIKLFAGKVENFNCAGRFIAQQLCRANIPSHRITVSLPEVIPIKSNPRRYAQLRRRFQIDPHAPLLLALAPPHDCAALKPVVHAAAILKHVLAHLTLLIAGPCSVAQQDCLNYWQDTMDAPNMIHLVNESADWDDLTRISDVVIAGSERLTDVIRLLHTRAAQKPLVAVRGDGNEFLANYPPARLLKSPVIRPLAAALLSCFSSSISSAAGPPRPAIKSAR